MSLKQFSLEGEHWTDFCRQVILKCVPFSVDMLLTSKNSYMNTNTIQSEKEEPFSRLIRVSFKVTYLKQILTEKWSTKSPSHQSLSFDQHNQGAFRKS